MMGRSRLFDNFINKEGGVAKVDLISLLSGRFLTFSCTKLDSFGVLDRICCIHRHFELFAILAICGSSAHRSLCKIKVSGVTS
jgi:hypothetical protein